MPTPEPILGTFNTSKANCAANFDKTSQDLTKITYENGIPSAYSIPEKAGGKCFTRQEMNRLMHMALQGQYLAQAGIPVMFNQGVCDAIGGYPKGAVLTVIDWEHFTVREYVSTNDDNITDPGSSSSVGWKDISGLNYDFWPDYGNMTNLASVSERTDQQLTVELHDMATTGWVFVKAVRDDIDITQDIDIGKIIERNRSKLNVSVKPDLNVSPLEYSFNFGLGNMTSGIIPVCKGYSVDVNVFNYSSDKVSLGCYFTATRMA